jgi:hypothetical protein
MPPLPKPQPLSYPLPPAVASRRQCTKTKTAAVTAEARTTVMAATVLVHCLYCHHLIGIVAHYHPLPLNCPLCTIVLVLPPLPLSSSLPATLVALATALHHCMPASFVTIDIALPPSPSSSLAHLRRHCPHRCRHSRRCRHLPRCCLPTTFVAVTIAFATIAITIVIACHPRCHCNPPLHCLCLHLPATLVPVALPLSRGGGEDHTNPVRDPTYATAAGATIIVAAFAARATGREGPVKQHACIQRRADGMHQRGVAAVGVLV